MPTANASLVPTANASLVPAANASLVPVAANLNKIQNISSVTGRVTSIGGKVNAIKTKIQSYIDMIKSATVYINTSGNIINEAKMQEILTAVTLLKTNIIEQLNTLDKTKITALEGLMNGLNSAVTNLEEALASINIQKGGRRVMQKTRVKNRMGCGCGVKLSGGARRSLTRKNKANAVKAARKQKAKTKTKAKA